MKLTKARVHEAEAQWRRFVFNGRPTQVAFWAGISLLPLALVLPEPVRSVLMGRIFFLWFGCLLLYFASANLLTAISSVLRRDFATTVWMGFWVVVLAAAATSVLHVGLMPTGSP